MKLLLLVALLGVAYVAAECPEACNGHGFCGEYDKCSCYRNWQGNSCADRTCPFDIAFVDIPHGDLNMDGKLDDEITTYGAQINDIYAFEVYPTDGYMINRDSDNDSADDVMRVSTSAHEKHATFYDMVEDGHFYAECSNKGMCDRKSGQCDCFDGYSGTACRRVACPNDCSGHGTCETIAETSTNTYQLWDRYKTQVCDCDAGYFGIDCAQRHCPYGDDPLSTDQHNEIQWLTLRTNGDGSHGVIDSPAVSGTCSADGTTACTHANTATTCTGDGNACSVTTYTAGDLDLEGTFTLAYKDEYGETWNTSPINAHSYDISTNTVNDATAAAIKAALEGIPNSVFEEVDVEVWPIQDPMPGIYKCDAGNKCALQADAGSADATIQTKTAAAMVDAFTATGGVTYSGGTYKGKYKWGVSNCKRAGTATNGGDGETAMPGYIKGKYGGLFGEDVDFLTTQGSAAFTAGGSIQSEAATHLCRYDMNGFRAKITFKKNPGDINELTCDADLVTTPEHKDSEAPSTDISCTSSDSLAFELGGVGNLDGSSIGGGNGGQMVTNMGLRAMMTHGDRIDIGGVTSTIAGPIANPTQHACAVIVIEEERASAVAITSGGAAPQASWNGKGTSENTECSHRGLCNHDEGLCECFTGYTHDDCSMQDALNA